MKDGEAPDVLSEAMLNLARHNVQVILKQTMEKFFQAAKKVGRESAEQARAVDDFVRRFYSDQPRKMAEWDEIMAKYEFMDDVIDDQQ